MLAENLATHRLVDAGAVHVVVQRGAVAGEGDGHRAYPREVRAGDGYEGIRVERGAGGPIKRSGENPGRLLLAVRHHEPHRASVGVVREEGGEDGVALVAE